MRYIMFVTALAVVGTPALAGKENAAKKTPDPNRVICRTDDVIGSRLSTERRCLTALQWSQLEQDQRNTVERVQTYKPTQGN